MIKTVNPETLSQPFAQYSHGVLADKIDGLILTSGQLGMSKEGDIPSSAFEQAVICFDNIDEILKSAGSRREWVLRVNAYVIAREHMQGYMAARDAWLRHTDHLPASTLMIVSGFTRPEFLVEVEVSAAVIDFESTC